MGVGTLWQQIDSGVTRTETPVSSLAEYALVNSVPVDSGLVSSVAVDASVWLVSSDTVSSSLSSFSDHVLMRTLLAKTLRLVSARLSPIFVFDSGPPATSESSHTPPAQAIRFKQLLDALKLPHFTAPVGVGAEAECARLQSNGIVSAVMTDDVDAFLFGASVVVRNWSGETRRALDASNRFKSENNGDSSDLHSPDSDAEPRKAMKKNLQKGVPSKGIGTGLGKDTVAVYTLDQITSQLGWTRYSLVLMALLAGSDNAPGIPGIGLKTAGELARSATHATSILSAALSNDTPKLRTSLTDLLTQLRTNALNLLSQKRPSALRDLPTLLDSLCGTWPSLAANYLNPRTSLTPFLRDSLAQYTKEDGWSSRKYDPDPAALLAWLQQSLDCGQDTSRAIYAAQIQPVLRMRALHSYLATGRGDMLPRVPSRIDTPTRSLRDFFPGTKPDVSSPAATPASTVPATPSFLCAITREKTLNGRRLLRVTWSEAALRVGAPAALPCTGVLDERDLKRDARVEARVARTRRVWMDARLVRRIAAELVEAWESRGSPTRRKGVPAHTAELGREKDEAQAPQQQQTRVTDFFRTRTEMRSTSAMREEVFVTPVSNVRGGDPFESDDDVPAARRRGVKRPAGGASVCPPAPRKKKAFFPVEEMLARAKEPEVLSPVRKGKRSAQESWIDSWGM
ncbi:hypothetical protein BC830DRAFT_1174493 [Chytriomyces sp. MP71]|nr:hypothetical protein BC830DRAFT_1174493 [Chytriomyces sp. MP71]